MGGPRWMFRRTGNLYAELDNLALDVLEMSRASVTLRTIVGGVHAWPPNIGQLVVHALTQLP